MQDSLDILRTDYKSEDFIEHHGIKGMKWGVRRFQNYDGTRIKKNSLLNRIAQTQANMFPTMAYLNSKEIAFMKKHFPNYYNLGKKMDGIQSVNIPKDKVSNFVINKEARKVSEDINMHSYNRINEMYKSMPYNDRKMIDPDSTEKPKDYFKSQKHYNEVTAYNKVTKDGFIVAEKIPKKQNVDGTKGVEIGIGVINKGKGHGTELTKSLVKWFDKQKEYDVLWWPVDHSNKASIRVAENNGFFKDPLGDNWVLPKDSAYEKLGIKR